MRHRIRPALTALWTSAVIAIVANLLILLGGTAANGSPVTVEQPGMTLEVDALATIAASIVGSLLAAAGALVLISLLRRGALVFAIAGAALTLLSLAGTLAATTTTGVAMLMTMHLVTGTVVVIGNVTVHSRSEARAPQSTR